MLRVAKKIAIRVYFDDKWLSIIIKKTSVTAALGCTSLSSSCSSICNFTLNALNMQDCNDYFDDCFRLRPSFDNIFSSCFFSVLLIVICRTLKNIIICFLCYYFIDNMSSKPPPQPVEQSWLLRSIRSSWWHFPAEATFPPLPMIQGGVFEESNAYKKKCNHLLNRKRSMCKLALEWQLVFNLD